MPIISPSSFLRRALLADAAMSGAAGLLMMLGADFLTEPTGLPVALLRYAGLSLLPFAALLIWLATRASLPQPAVWVVIACNVSWTADSILLLLAGWVAPTALGKAFVVAQALAVLVMAELEYLGLRKSTAAVALHSGRAS
ncbi:MAG TPA: hypothetical protein VFD58_25150 [Blastocatellia bacterium]|nr:hypothetical protein [Blastocatellia bacterium]